MSCESRAEVDDLVAQAKAAGGAVPRMSADRGFMPSDGFEGVDGHLWELRYMLAPPEA